jgi:hypothetical protein
MSLVVLLARVVLALIFLVTGLAKLADLVGSRQALRDFGVSLFWPTPLACCCKSLSRPGEKPCASSPAYAALRKGTVQATQERVL